MSKYFEAPVGDPQEENTTVEIGTDVYLCGCGERGEWYSDNNESGKIKWYCGSCEEHRAEKYGCAMLLSEGPMCQDGACGCGGTGRL